MKRAREGKRGREEGHRVLHPLAYSPDGNSSQVPVRLKPVAKHFISSLVGMAGTHVFWLHFLLSQAYQRGAEWEAKQQGLKQVL